MTLPLKLQLSIAAVIALILLIACNPNTESAIAEIDPFESAKKIYSATCASCHGQQMQMFVDRKWKHGTTDDSLAMSITNGYLEGGMPSFDTIYSEVQIKELVAYIQDGISKTGEFTFEDPFNPDTTFNDGGISYTLELITDSVDVPWGYVFLPDNSMIINDKDGDMYHRDPNGTLTSISNAPKVVNKGQGGLLDIELDPDYTSNGLLYISYSKGKMDGDKELITTAVIRAKYENHSLTDVHEILEAQPYLSTRHHYGGRLEFDKDGYLFVSVGDRGKRDDNPQSLANHCGKIHRINSDGSIPEDNPFVDTLDAVKSIWSYGHRNPQGLVYDAKTNTLWEHEHGPRGGDELNIIRKGDNYGWPLASFGINYNGTTFTNKTEIEGMTNSEKYWVPSIAPCGMAQVTSDKYPEWKGDILVGSLRFRYIAKVALEKNKAGADVPLVKNVGRVRNVKLDREGYIYVSTENPGAIYKLLPANEI